MKRRLSVSEHPVDKARLRRWIAWTWAGTVVAVAIINLPGFIADADGSVVGGVAWALIPVAFTSLGALIATRKPGTHLTWIMMIVGSTSLLIGFSGDSLQRAPADPGFVDFVLITLLEFSWMGIIFPIFLLLYLFPNGRFLSRRWWWAGWLSAFDVILLVVLGSFTTKVGTNGWTIPNPIGFIDPAFLEGRPFLAFWSFSLVALALGGFAAMIVRYRRSPLTVRTQIKWVLYSTSIFAVVYAIAVPQELWLGNVIGTLIPFSITLIPVSIAAAIVQYRLFDIDRLISRTVSYGLVVALLGGVFLVLTWLPSIVIAGANEDGASGSAPPAVVAASTLAVAALFNPVRRRVQRMVDTRFNRTGYHAEEVSAELTTSLSDLVTVEQVESGWVATVQHALQPRAVGIWVRDS